MRNEAPQFVPKVHPASRAVEAEDPMTLTATPVAWDPEEMLRCVIQEYAWMGWNLDQLMCLFRDPFFPALFGLWGLYGEVGLRERVAAVLDRMGVFQFQTTVVEEAEPDDEEPELIQLGWRSRPTTTGKGGPMPQVYDWQLGRPMSYPYAEAHPQWQFAFVFNTNRCIGCQTCTMACKSTWTFSKGQEYLWWNNVETKPHGGYPQHWDAKLLAMLEAENPGGQVWNTLKADGQGKPYGVFEGKTVFEAAERRVGPEGAQAALGYLPTDAEWRHPNIHEDTATGGQWQPGRYGGTAQLPEHRVWFFHLARICNHCTYPGCLGSCPRQAIYKRPEDGIVLIDQERCRGYRKCVEGCPYKKAMYRSTTRTSEKCVGCYPRIEGKDGTLSPEGDPLETRCMSACVGKIRLQGLVRIDANGTWANDPANPLYFLIRERQVALPLYPQFGTEPNGFYIPPRWVPRDYLVQMFGPGVDHAIEQYSCPDRKLLAVLQLFRAQRHILFRFEIQEGPKVAEIPVRLPSGKEVVQEIYNDTVIGYNKRGAEVVRITIEEPTFERPREHHLNSI